MPRARQNINMVAEENDEQETVQSKKRGRKPKGGKLVIKNTETNAPVIPVTNIILHLKCSLKDLNDYNTNMTKMVTNPLDYNPEVPPDILTYNEEDNQAFFSYKNETEVQTHYAYNESTVQLCSNCNSKETKETMEQNPDDDDVNIKDLNYKLKRLKISLYKNAIHDKQSACFWCTYEFDNSPCYIPKYEMDGQICGYGSFCRPECAVAFLMKENIDDSAKFERYHLLNQIYSKVYDFKKNIKPAPNPYYLLDKFYGTLSIQEYRKLLKTEHMLLVIDKPLTRILPELHEDNEDMVLNIYGGSKTTHSGNSSGVYKVKRQSEKPPGPTKNSIMRNKFGLTA
jgi:hypothetical protein